MANHLSTQKSIRKTLRKTIINRSRKSRVRTFIKKIEKAISSGLLDEAKKTLVVTQSEIMRSVSAGIMKKNTGSRKVSRLNRLVKNYSYNKNKQI